YTPSANFVGEDSITYEVSDGNGGVANSTVAVTVNSTEDDPITIVGTGAAETLEGGNNNDNLAAKGGKDVLYGYEGNDTLHGGGGADSLYGGLG
ncbi:cadherin-like domain-containing protein, partial [Oleiphilus sp. HI0086]